MKALEQLICRNFATLVCASFPETKGCWGFYPSGLFIFKYMKKCSKCNINKEFVEFNRDKSTKSGYQSYCKLCSKAKATTNNVLNKESHLKSNRKWASKNSDLIKKIKSNWAKSNPGKCAAGTAKYRASKRLRTPAWLTESQLTSIKEFYLLAADLSLQSEEKLHVDHIVPLNGDNVSGLHVPWNLQIIPASKNLKKGNR